MKTLFHIDTCIRGNAMLPVLSVWFWLPYLVAECSVDLKGLCLSCLAPLSRIFPFILLHYNSLWKEWVENVRGVNGNSERNVNIDLILGIWMWLRDAEFLFMLSHIVLVRTGQVCKQSSRIVAPEGLQDIACHISWNFLQILIIRALYSSLKFLKYLSVLLDGINSDTCNLVIPGWF